MFRKTALVSPLETVDAEYEYAVDGLLQAAKDLYDFEKLHWFTPSLAGTSDLERYYNKKADLLTRLACWRSWVLRKRYQRTLIRAEKE